MEKKYDFSGSSPWPQIRKKRIKELLPKAMQLAEVDVWVIICRENANDPLASHVGGENAGREMGIIFELSGDTVQSTAFSPWGEVVGLREMDVHDEIITLENPETLYQKIADRLHKLNPGAIAINSSNKNIADGLSYTQRKNLEQALGFMKDNLVSSQDLVSEWLAVKLDEEIEIMTRAGELTVKIILDAYKKIVPGQTTDKEVADWIREGMEFYNVKDAWSENHNPSVNSGVARGHAGPSQKVIYPNDFIQTDFGIKVYDRWCTDYQRFAYVLEKGSEVVPEEDLKKWKSAVKGHRLVLAEMKPGLMGYDLDLIQREWMNESGSDNVRWGTGHPVGYFAHDIGPALTGGQREVPPTDALRVLREGMVFAYDGFYAWQVEQGERLISVEEMAVVTKDGGKYLIPPQEDLILIKS
ncbi:MAG: M24 family metallopeptidase [Clostridia bacterium]